MSVILTRTPVGPACLVAGPCRPAQWPVVAPTKSSVCRQPSTCSESKDADSAETVWYIRGGAACAAGASAGTRASAARAAVVREVRFMRVSFGSP